MNGNLPRHLTLFTFALSLLLMSGCNQSPAARIERVLNQCAKIAAKASVYQDTSVQAGYVAREFQAVDVSDCPPEFRAAFQDHVNAWSQAQISYGQNSVANNIVQGAVAALTDNPSSIASLGLQAFAANQDINNTYYRLTMIAATYGARIPHSSVQ